MKKYMVIERFKPGAATAIYERFDRRGRLLPDGLKYVDSWTSDDLTTCFQLMETDEDSLFQQWVDQWSDLVDFEIIQVLSSEQARKLAMG